MRSAGWRPARIASTMSGARKAKRIVRPTSERSQPARLARPRIESSLPSRSSANHECAWATAATRLGSGAAKKWLSSAITSCTLEPRRRRVPLFGRPLSSLPMVESQHSAEPFVTSNTADIPGLPSWQPNQSVSESLMVPLDMVMFCILRDGETQMSFAERDDPRQALRLNGMVRPAPIKASKCQYETFHTKRSKTDHGHK